MSTPKWVSINSKWNWGSPRSYHHSDWSTVELCLFMAGLGHRLCGPLVPSVIYWQLLPNDLLFISYQRFLWFTDMFWGFLGGGLFCLIYLFSSVWPWIHHPPVSALQVLELQECAITSGPQKCFCSIVLTLQSLLASLEKSVDTRDNVDKILSLREINDIYLFS